MGERFWSELERELVVHAESHDRMALSTNGAQATTAAPRHPAAFRVSDGEPGPALVDVEGDLRGAEVNRWSALLNGVIHEGSTAIAVDLRGCHSVDPICVSVMSAASSILKSRGGDGVKLVTYPGSRLDDRVRALAAEELPVYASAATALVSFGFAG